MRISILNIKGVYMNITPTLREVVPYGTILEKIPNEAKYHSKFQALGMDRAYIIGNTMLAKKIELGQINILENENNF